MCMYMCIVHVHGVLYATTHHDPSSDAKPPTLPDHLKVYGAALQLHIARVPDSRLRTVPGALQERASV